MRTRIAAVGDSLTMGDNFQAYPANKTRRCLMHDGACRGNYPLDLQELLGSDGYHVGNFGISGRAACANLPEACFETGQPQEPSSPASDENVAPKHPNPHLKPIQHEAKGRRLESSTNNPAVRLPLSLNSSQDALHLCSSALRNQRHGLLQKALAFDPHIIALMIGTNDAAAGPWDQCGAEGFRRALLLFLREFWVSHLRKNESSPPWVLLLVPPPVLGEFSTHGCVAMHSCRYHPTRACYMVGECASCGKGDMYENPSCVRISQLPTIRRIVISIGKELSRVAAAMRAANSSSPRGESWETRCGQIPLHLMQGNLVPPRAELFTGPIHLQARASALIACHVHERLQQHCGANQCTDNLGAGLHNVTLSRNKHHAYCEPLRKGLFLDREAEQYSHPAYWTGLRKVLFPPRPWLGEL